MSIEGNTKKIFKCHGILQDLNGMYKSAQFSLVKSISMFAELTPLVLYLVQYINLRLSFKLLKQFYFLLWNANGIQVS